MSLLRTPMGVEIKTYMEVMGMVNSIVVQWGKPLSTLVRYFKAIFSLEETMMFWRMESNDCYADKIIRCGGFYCTLVKNG